MKNKIYYFLIIISSLLFLSYSQDIQLMLNQAEDLYRQREDLSKAKEAMKLYEEIIEIDPQNYEAHWKLAKTIYYIGERSPKAERLFLYKKGIEIAKKAVKLGPNKPEGHFFLAVLYGVYGQTRGVLKSLFLVDDIKKEVYKTIAINPTIECGGPYQLLGRLYYELPGFFGGSKKKSLRLLLKAKSICDSDPLTYLYLADTYLALGEKEKAKEELKKAIEIEPHPDLIPEAKEYKKQAEEKLEKLEK
jgi:tetratricopeptide (TPR) repeat protein